MKILDADGKPMKPAAQVSTAYTAADPVSQELANWHPSIGSADGEHSRSRNTIVARARDLERNTGWGASYLTRRLDNVIGIGFRLSSKPDYNALGLSPEWAHEFALEVEGRWRIFAEDPQFYIDATREDNFNGLLRIAFRHYATEGEAIALPLWIEGKPGGRAATTFQIIDTDRLSNPNDTFDTDRLRSGIELNDYGAPVAYHFRKSHPGDMYISGAKSFEWERVSRETNWGRLRVIHAFEKKRAGQTRGISPLAPVIERFKMVDKYDKVELQAAVLNAILAAFIESPMDHELLIDSLDDGALGKYQKDRSEFHKERNLRLNGVKIPTLYPGEKIGMLNAARPNTAFADFERACLRNIAAGLGLSYEQLSQDWSQTNYSSARAAIQEVWKTLSSDRETFANKFATPMFLLWLEEEIVSGRIRLPDGAPNFYAATAAYGRVKWIGQGRGYIDPEKEAKAQNMRLNNMTSTLEAECAEQGLDWMEVLDQREREQKEIDRRGLSLPDWASAQPQAMYQQPPAGEQE